LNNSPSIPDRGHLATEQRLPAARDLDTLSVAQTLQLINSQDAAIPAAVAAAIPLLTRLVDDVVAGLRRGGRLLYLGAGTSGRLGVLDASECPPTFHVDPGQVVGIIAGGDGALRKSSEGAEDDPAGAHDELTRLSVTANDVVVGIAAGGTTPYVHGALRFARARGAVTGLICCVHLDPAPPTDVAVHLVELLVGPEVLTGSTRMKAGTATKLALNMISTTTMVQLGKAWGNLMVDVRASNIKLRDRAARIITSQTGLSRDQALALLDQAQGRVKHALVMAKRRVGYEEADGLLVQAFGQGKKLRDLIGNPADC